MLRGITGRLAAAAGVAVLALAGAASSASAAAPSSVFGSVNLAFRSHLSASDAARMARGGVTSMRLSFDWFGVEGQKGSFNWDRLDRIVGNLASQGVEALPVLFGTPRWAVKELPEDPFPEDNRALRASPSGPVRAVHPSGNATAYPPVLTREARVGWKHFVAAAVRRYGPGGSYWSVPYLLAHPGATPVPIRTWQVWNEPNIAGAFWPAVNVTRYGKLVKLTARSIRAIDPSATVALAGLPGEVDYRGVTFIKTLYRRVPQIKRYFDEVAFHPYGTTIKESVGQLVELRKALRRHGDGGVPLWVSEVGWGSGKPVKNHFNFGPEGQATMLHRLFKALDAARQRLHLGLVSWFDWRDPHRNDVDCGWCGRAGLIDWHGKRKPAWDAYRNFVGRPRP